MKVGDLIRKSLSSGEDEVGMILQVDDSTLPELLLVLWSDGVVSECWSDCDSDGEIELLL